MSEQKTTQASTKRHGNRKTSKQNGLQTPAPQCPANDDKEAWKGYWQAQGQSWRTEPEIDKQRQEYLAQHRAITPDIQHSIYPFKDVKLSRADMEWLLATHEPAQRGAALGLHGADLRTVDLRGLALEQVILYRARLEEVNLEWVHLEEADLRGAHLEKANLYRTHLEEADLRGAHLEEAYLGWAHLEGACLNEAHLERCDLSGAFFTSSTDLEGIVLGNDKTGLVSLAGTRWGGVDLSAIDWTKVKILGEERQARQRNTKTGGMKGTKTRLEEYRKAARTNRQLVVALQAVGLHEEADHFAYRAQLLQREVWRLQRRPLKYALSWFLYLLAGYGYRPVRSLLWYLVIIVGFALVLSDNHSGPSPKWYWWRIQKSSLNSEAGSSQSRSV